MTLGEKQRAFSRFVGILISHAYSVGLEVTFGDAYRSPEQAALNAARGVGITNSLHRDRLAVDLNLFVNGQYSERPEDYLPLGEFWESLSPDLAWGGRFSKPDLFHFSYTHEGRR